MEYSSQTKNGRLFARNCLITLIMAAMSPLASAAGGDAASLQGEAFLDHKYVKKMKREWVDKKVTYDKKIKNADLVLSLGQQTHPALSPLVKKMAKERGLNVVIQQGSCGKTAKKLNRKAVDVGAYCCPPMKKDRLPGLEFHTVGIAAIAFVTHSSNPLKNISSIEAQDIYRGEYVNWSEVPSAKKLNLTGDKIQPVVRLHCKKRPGHWRHLLKNEDLFSPRTFEVGVIPDMIKQVAKNKAAIGLETVFMLDVHKKHGKLNILSVDGHKPEQEEFVLNGQYPIYRTYNLTTWVGEGKNYDLAKEFVAELKAHVEKEGEKYGFISPSKLKKAGWVFEGDELIAEPDGMPVIHEHPVAHDSSADHDHT